MKASDAHIEFNRMRVAHTRNLLVTERENSMVTVNRILEHVQHIETEIRRLDDVLQNFDDAREIERETGMPVILNRSDDAEPGTD
jgi:hypothetical protein